VPTAEERFYPSGRGPRIYSAWSCVCTVSDSDTKACPHKAPCGSTKFTVGSIKRVGPPGPLGALRMAYGDVPSLSQEHGLLCWLWGGASGGRGGWSGGGRRCFAFVGAWLPWLSDALVYTTKELAGRGRGSGGVACISTIPPQSHWQLQSREPQSQVPCLWPVNREP
jgi:hypothetical protein